jgi:hypothetical protein
LQESNPISHAMTPGVDAGHIQSNTGNIHGNDFHRCLFFGQTHGNCAAAGANVENLHR